MRMTVKHSMQYTPGPRSPAKLVMAKNAQELVRLDNTMPYGLTYSSLNAHKERSRRYDRHLPSPAEPAKVGTAALQKTALPYKYG